MIGIRRRGVTADHGRSRFVRRLMIGGYAVLLGLSMAVMPRLLSGSDSQQTPELIRTTCAGCHRLQGPPASRFEKQAPDLIGAGSKFKRAWLVGWLTGKEPPVYALGYRVPVWLVAPGFPIIGPH